MIRIRARPDRPRHPDRTACTHGVAASSSAETRFAKVREKFRFPPPRNYFRVTVTEHHRPPSNKNLAMIAPTCESRSQQEDLDSAGEHAPAAISAAAIEGECRHVLGRG